MSARLVLQSHARRHALVVARRAARLLDHRGRRLFLLLLLGHRDRHLLLLLLLLHRWHRWHCSVVVLLVAAVLGGDAVLALDLVVAVVVHACVQRSALRLVVVVLVRDLLVEADVCRHDEAPVVRAPDLVLAPAVADSGEEADLGLGVQLAAVLLGHVDVAEAAEDSKVLHVWLLSGPRLVCCLAADRARWSAVVDPLRHLHGLAPELVGHA